MQRNCLRFDLQPISMLLFKQKGLTMNYQNRITIDPKIMVGKPCIKGTRVTVEQVLKLLAQGITTEEILEDYPHITRKDIQAAIDYAYRIIGRIEIFPTVQFRTKV